jgi:hypothetical protein
MTDEFIYLPMLDSPGNDIMYIADKNINNLKETCRNTPECMGFNTSGLFKNKIIDEPIKSQYYKNQNNGLYIHSTRFKHIQNKKDFFRIKILSNSNNLFIGEIPPDVQIVTSDNSLQPVDFYLILDSLPLPDTKAGPGTGTYNTSRTILFYSEESKIEDTFKNINLLKKIKYVESIKIYEQMINFLKEYQFSYTPTNEEINYHHLIGKSKETLQKVCFIHSCTINGNRNVLDDLIEIIVESELYESLDRIFIINIGDRLETIVLDKKSNNILKKIVMINYSLEPKLFELPTINLLNIFSKFNPDTKLLYIHTKGTSYSQYTNVNDWKNMMLYFLVENHKTCIKLLDRYDTVGCNYLVAPHKHYSGNFWWANCRYLKQLSQIVSGTRHDAEWWIMTGSDKIANNCVIHHSYINHYLQSYPRHLYDMIETKIKLNNLVANLIK